MSVNKPANGQLDWGNPLNAALDQLDASASAAQVAANSAAAAAAAAAALAATAESDAQSASALASSTTSRVHDVELELDDKLNTSSLDDAAAALFGTATQLRDAVDDRVGIGAVSDSSVATQVTSGPLTAVAIDTRIVAQKDWILAKDYTPGAGLVDETTTAQAALDAVDPAKGKMTVYFGPGTYLVNGVNTSQTPNQNRWIGGGLKPKAGTTVILDPNAIIKVITNGSPGYSAIYVGPGVDNVTIKGGQVFGDRALHDYTTDTSYPTHEAGYGIAGRGAHNLTVDGVTVTGMTGDSVFLGADGFDKSSPGYLGCTGKVINSTLSGARRNNLSIEGCDSFLIENNDILDAGTNDGHHDGTLPRMGIDLEFGTAERVANVTIRGNRFTGNQNGAIENYNATGVTIEGNFADAPIVTGVHSDSNCTIRGNVLVNRSDTTRTAITVQSGAGATANLITDNIILGFGSGILASGKGVVVEGNYVSEFTVNGILAYQAQDCSIIGNLVFDAKTGSTGAGIQLSTPATAPVRINVAANTISNCYKGIELTNGAVGVVAIGNTIIKGNQAITVGGGSQGVFKNNVVDLPGHAAGQGVDIGYSSTSNVVIVENTIRNSSTYSIQGQSGGTGGVSRIIRNTIQDSTSTIAVLVSDGTHLIIGNIISVNRASGSFYGISVGGASVSSKIINNIGYATGASPYGSFIITSAATGTPASVVFGNMFDGATVVSTHASDIVGENFSSTKSLVNFASAQTLTNKRITPRVVTTTTASTLVIDSDATDVAVRTGQGGALSVSAPTGTPTDGQLLIFRVTDDGTARALTYNSAFRSLTATLPSTTVINTPLVVTSRWNAAASKWDVISVTGAAGGAGDVVGPGSSVSADFATFSGTTGKLLQDSGLSLDTDGTFAANSDVKIPSQKAVKTAVALKKTDSMSTNKLLGRGTASTGAIEEITLGTNLSLTGTTLNASGGGAPTRGQYVRSGGYIGVSGSGTMSVGASNGYYRPLFVKKGGTITSVKINVTTASGAGGLVQVALYPHNATTGLPTVGAPTFSTLSIDTTSTGVKTTTVSWTVTDDTIYWIYVGATVSTCTLSAVTANTADDLLGASSNATTYIGALLDWGSGGLTGPPSSPDPRIAAGQIPSFPSVSFGS